MTIGEDIVKWAATRPIWQQRILQLLAAGHAIAETELAALIDELIDPQPEDADVEPLDLAMPSADEDQVRLIAVRDCKGVNALADGEELTFHTSGLTVVYGDNGSGKSGYARLIKDMVGARHPAEVLPDVFEDAPPEPAARLTFMVGADEEDQKYPGAPAPSIKKISFYDEHCGDAYIEQRSVVTYRPSALVLLDGLITVCDRLRNAISTMLVENDRGRVDLNIAAETEAGMFLAGITASTTQAAIDAATTLDPAAATERADAAAVVARLETSDATKERARIQARAAALRGMVVHLQSMSKDLDKEALATAAKELEHAATMRAAAQTAASADFSHELPGVGSETWRALWLAARDYSAYEAYHEQPFPVVHNKARCVLCQQTLGADAIDRLSRFEQYMTDTTEREASSAESVVAQRIDRVRAIAPVTATSSTQLNEIEAIDAGLARSVAEAISAAEAARSNTLDWLAGDRQRPDGLNASSLIESLEQRALAETSAADDVDIEGFQQALSDAQTRRRNIEATFTLSEAKDAIEGEVRRLKERAQLQSAYSEVSTTAITAKCTQLTKEYVGDNIKNEFIRETERLRLQRVTIKDLGGNKGQLEQQPALLGAKASRVRAVQVLSEGEQTAMGLAGFFTEAAFDPSKSALVLDDPVTSLDHVRREYVAARLAELAKDRQVVVFTHDVVFVGELQKAAGAAGVEITPRSVERHGTVPGHVRTSLPWKAKDFKARLAVIEQNLATLTKNRANYGQDDWDKEVGTWAGDLSELWESCVTSEILDEVFERGTSEVRALKFRILAAVTSQDDKDFQAGYGACSKWARRHNKSAETNYVPPEPVDMEAELERIRGWQKRVKKYRD